MFWTGLFLVSFAAFYFWYWHTVSPSCQFRDAMQVILQTVQDSNKRQNGKIQLLVISDKENQILLEVAKSQNYAIGSESNYCGREKTLFRQPFSNKINDAADRFAINPNLTHILVDCSDIRDKDLLFNLLHHSKVFWCDKKIKFGLYWR